MPSLREIKCPVCRAENGPCLVEDGMDMYHTERKRAAYPTTYEHPDCEECRQLKDAMVRAEDSYRTCRPDMGTTKPKSRWPKDWRDELYRRQMAANLTRAKYGVHLGADHKDANHQHDLGSNLAIILRKGRLKP